MWLVSNSESPRKHAWGCTLFVCHDDYGIFIPLSFIFWIQWTFVHFVFLSVVCSLYITDVGTSCWSWICKKWNYSSEFRCNGLLPEVRQWTKWMPEVVKATKPIWQRYVIEISLSFWVGGQCQWCYNHLVFWLVFFPHGMAFLMIIKKLFIWHKCFCLKRLPTCHFLWQMTFGDF